MILLFICSAIVVFCFDYKLWNAFTPVMISFSGIIFILCSHYLLGESLGFKRVDDSVYVFLTMFLYSAFASSLICNFLVHRININVRAKVRNNEIYSDKKRIFIIYFCFFLSCICLMFIIKSWMSLGNLVSEDFESSLTYGVAGHSFALLVASLPFLVKCIYTRKSAITIALLFCVFLLLFMKQVKYWVMIPFVWMVWYCITSKFVKLSLIKTLLITSCVIIFLLCFFFLVYLMKVMLSNVSGNLDYLTIIYDITIHFFGYLYSGVITFSAYIQQGFYTNLSSKDLWGLFAGPLNVINVLLHNDLIELELNRPFIILNSFSLSVGNVPTLWGTILLAGGYTSILIYFLINAFLYMLLFATKFSNLAILIYTFLTSFLFFSWFDYYYYLLMPFEVAVFCSLFYILFEKAKFSKLKS